jgi:hypothetical protein
MKKILNIQIDRGALYMQAEAVWHVHYVELKYVCHACKRTYTRQGSLSVVEGQRLTVTVIFLFY